MKHLNAFTKYIYQHNAWGDHMVKVITIMDDVYAELYRIKRSKGLSFSGVIRYLMEEKEKESKNIISLAGSINDEDLDRKAMEGIKKGMHEWGKYV